MSDWLGPWAQLWGEKEQGRWHGIWGLADGLHCGLGPAECLQGHRSYPSFSLWTWRPGQEWLHLSLQTLVHGSSSVFRAVRPSLLSLPLWPSDHHLFSVCDLLTPS